MPDPEEVKEEPIVENPVEEVGEPETPEVETIEPADAEDKVGSMTKGELRQWLKKELQGGNEEVVKEIQELRVVMQRPPEPEPAPLPISKEKSPKTKLRSRTLRLFPKKAALS